MNNLDRSIISAENENSFLKSMKIGYFKEFYKKGLISAEQLDLLISMQNNQQNAS